MFKRTYVNSFPEPGQTRRLEFRSFDQQFPGPGSAGAYDVTNFAKNFKEFPPEVSGSKESGCTYTARGLSNAVELAKEMVGLTNNE